jgi:hypothetical protein
MKIKLKMLTCFGMIWNCNNLSGQNTKFGKMCTLKRIHNNTKLIIKIHKTYWGKYKYNK